MYRSNYEQAINPIIELNNILEYLKSRWIIWDHEEFTDVINHVWYLGLQDGQDLLCINKLYDNLELFYKKRNDKNVWSENNPHFDIKMLMHIYTYDAIYYYQKNLFTSLNKITTFIKNEFDFEKNMKKILKLVKESNPNYIKLKPIGWNKLLKTYHTDDGMDEYLETQEEIDRNDFKGVNTSGASSGDFTIRTSLPYVMYDEKEQGRKKSYTLLSCIYSHALFVREHNNTVKFKKDLLEVMNILEQKKYYDKIYFDFNIEDITSNYFLILSDKYLKELAEHNKVSQEEFDKIINTPYKEPEVKINQTDAINMILAKFKNTSSGIISEEEKEKQIKEKAILSKIVFNSSPIIKKNKIF